tara:strand:- start:39 stop:482 length:444 start_codon:yes stop_codon:yes gene_type:complete
MPRFKTRKESLSYDQPKLGILEAIPTIGSPLLGYGLGGGGKRTSVKPVYKDQKKFEKDLASFMKTRKRKGKTRKEVEQQGGPLNKKLDDTHVYEALEDHGFSPEYHENGGVTAYEFLGNNRQGNPMYKKKHFKTNTSLKTLRNWLGY